MKRVDEENGNNNGRIDFNEFLPWYTEIAERHYKCVHGLSTVEPEVCSCALTPTSRPSFTAPGCVT
jgi:hypothetical protein